MSTGEEGISVCQCHSSYMYVCHSPTGLGEWISSVELESHKYGSEGNSVYDDTI